MQIPFSEFIRKKSILCTKQFMIFYTELRCECLCHPKFYSEVLTQTIIFQKQNQLLNSTECRLQLLPEFCHKVEVGREARLSLFPSRKALHEAKVQ